VGLLLFVAVSQAANDRPRFFVGFDYISSGNIEDSLEKTETDGVSTVVDEGGIPMPERESDAGIGGRVGIFFPVESDQTIEWGLSAGFINGPKTTLIVNDPSFPPGSLTSEFENSYIRGLIEIQKRMPLNSSVAFKFGAGIGVGQGKTTQTFTPSGYYDLFYLKTESSKKSTGLTWELSPSLVFGLSGKTELEIGVRYMALPKIKESLETYEVKYSGFGFFAGLSF